MQPEDFQLINPPREARGMAENEHYPTPGVLAAAALGEVIDLHWRRYLPRRESVKILEPGCGNAAPFLDAAKIVGNSHRVGCDLREVEKPFYGIDFVGGLDYLDADACAARNAVLFKPETYDLIITNPPFSLAVEFVERSMVLVQPFGLVAMLLQTGIEGSRTRADFWQRYPFLVKYLIVPRPSFIKGTSDSREYAIYVWPGPAMAVQLEAMRRSWSEHRVLEWR